MIPSSLFVRLTVGFWVISLTVKGAMNAIPYIDNGAVVAVWSFAAMVPMMLPGRDDDRETRRAMDRPVAVVEALDEIFAARKK